MGSAEEKAKKALQEYVVDPFNRLLKDWEDFSQYRANFQFTYDPETGRKRLGVLDLAPLDPKRPTDPSDPRVGSSEVILQEALKQVTETPDITYPITPTVEEVVVLGVFQGPPCKGTTDG